MTAKEFLQQVYVANGEIEMKLEEIERLRALATRTTSTIKSTPSGGSGSKSKIENAVIAIQEKIERLADEITKLLEVSELVGKAIAKVKEPTERRILEYRYLHFFSWKQIALMMKASERKVFQKHEQALKNFFAVVCSSKNVI